jgi:Flp pilus assembly protein TadD
MKSLTTLVVTALLAGCATCKSSDSPEVCRTKQRDKSQPRLEFALAGLLTPHFLLPKLRSM